MGRGLAWLLSGLTLAYFLVADPGMFDHLLHGAIGSDFKNLWLAGRALLDGQPVYDVEALTDYARAHDPDARYINFVYPPFVLFLAVPFSLLPVQAAFHAWNVLSAALFFMAAGPYVRDGVPGATALLTPAAVLCILFGQYGLLVGALWLWAFRLQPWAAAALAMKPHIGFLIAVPLLRRPRFLVVATLMLLGVVAVTTAVFGLSIWSQFAVQAFGNQGELIRSGSMAIWVRQGVTPLIGYGVWNWLLFGVAAALLLVRNFNVFTAATATFLISPYGLHYDLTVVCLGFALLLVTGWQELRWWERAIVLLAYFSPLLVKYGTWFVPPVLLLGLWVQVRRQHVAVGYSDSFQFGGSRGAAAETEPPAASGQAGRRA